MPVNGSGGHQTICGDLVNRFTRAKPAQRLAHRVAQPRAARQRGGRGERIIRKHLARVRLQMSRNLSQKDRAKFAQFLFAHPANAREFARAGRIIARHLPQRDVRENDVSRHVALVGQLFAQLLQALEQRLVAGNLADATRAGFRRGDRLGKRHLLALLEHRQALACQLQHAKLFRSLPQAAEPDQFAANRRPFGPAVLLADAVGG